MNPLQRLISAYRAAFAGLPRVQDELTAAEDLLADRGRVLLRYSGTEPVARVMVEGEDAGEIEAVAERLSDVIRSELTQKL